jgi:3-deoxy-7-phosphoheptulonate synthase
MLNLAAVLVIQRESYLPMVVDSSHAVGWHDLIFDMSLIAITVNASGLLIEVNYNSVGTPIDVQQMITPDELGQVIDICQKISRLVTPDRKKARAV